VEGVVLSQLVGRWSDCSIFLLSNTTVPVSDIPCYIDPEELIGGISVLAGWYHSRGKLSTRPVMNEALWEF
jgi:hypothetical protein